MKWFSIPVYAVALALLSSCQEAMLIDKAISAAEKARQSEKATENPEKPKTIEDGTVVLENEGSNTTSEVQFKDGKKNGLAKQYYPDGKIWKESPYKDGHLHGVAKVYDRQGRLQREVAYESGRKHGDYIKYFKSGKNQLKVTYDHDLPLPGIEQIDYRGEPLSAPEITVKKEDRLNEDGIYHYYFSLEPETKDAKYYLVQSKEDWSGTNMQLRNTLLPSENGTGHFEIALEKGYTINTEVYIYATYPVASGVDAAVVKKLPISIKN